MSTLEILNEALLNYTAVIRDSVDGKADSVNILKIISNTSNELKDLINTKADIGLLSGNSNEFSQLIANMQNDLNTRVLISDYNADNIQSNNRFNTKADIFNSTLTGLTSAQTIHSIGDIRTDGTLYASNLHVLGQTSIVNTVTTVTDQLTITNYGTDVA
jgi:restriction endonuclease